MGSSLERMKFQERHRAVVANNQILELIRYYFEHQQEVAEDLGLPTGYSLDHVGCLIYGDLESAQTLLRQHDLKVRRRFPQCGAGQNIVRKISASGGANDPQD